MPATREPAAWLQHSPPPTAAATAHHRRWRFGRLALGLAPTPRPELALLAAGAALGPHGLGVLSRSFMDALDPALSMALATLGVLVGLGIDLGRPRAARLLGAATLEAGITAVMVALGFALVHANSAAGRTPWLLVIMLGVCAASSSTRVDEFEEPASAGAAVGDFDDLLPIVASVVAVAGTRSAPASALFSLALQSGALAVAIAAAGWLLLSEGRSNAEHRVFVVALLLVIGGAAAHLSISALFLGLVAGACWNAAGGATREHVVQSVRYLQHPLLVLLLVLAGARLQVDAALAGLAAAYVVFRTLGKLVGGLAAGRMIHDRAGGLGWSLTAPGVVGIAIALNLLQMQPPRSENATVFTVVVAGSMAMALLSAAVPFRDDEGR